MTVSVEFVLLIPGFLFPQRHKKIWMVLKRSYITVFVIMTYNRVSIVVTYEFSQLHYSYKQDARTNDGGVSFNGITFAPSIIQEHNLIQTLLHARFTLVDMLFKTIIKCSLTNRKTLLTEEPIFNFSWPSCSA
jgi:hypothetical protein